MNTNSDRTPDEALLEATLNNEEWQAIDAGLKAEAMRSFHAGQRMRRIRRWSAATALVAVLAAAAVIQYARNPSTPKSQVAVESPPVQTSAPQERAMTDQELLAAFPRGSCFIAEVDGKKQLIFVNAQLEREFIAGQRP